MNRIALAHSSSAEAVAPFGGSTRDFNLIPITNYNTSFQPRSYLNSSTLIKLPSHISINDQTDGEESKAMIEIEDY